MSGELDAAHHHRETGDKEILRLREHLDLLTSQHKRDLQDDRRAKQREMDEDVQRSVTVAAADLERCREELDYCKVCASRP